MYSQQSEALKKNDPNTAKLRKRKEDFYNSLIPYVEVYGRQTIRDFFDYWTEPNKSCTRMRFELERTWNLNLRLQRWTRNTPINTKTPNADHTTSSKNARAADAAAIMQRLLDEDERNNQSIQDHKGGAPPV